MTSRLLSFFFLLSCAQSSLSRLLYPPNIRLILMTLDVSNAVICPVARHQPVSRFPGCPLCEPPTTEVAGFSLRRPEGSRKRKMTPHPCTQRAPDGFPDRLTAACSCGRLGCAGGWGCHAGYPAIWEATSASLYVARVTLVLFAASGTFAVTRDQPSFPRLDSRSRMR